MSADEITTTVKLLLGMSMQDTFELTPPISPPNPLPKNDNLCALWNANGNIFVKISGCTANTAYCVFSGILDSDTLLDQVETTEHKITTTNKTYNKMNGKEIKAYLEDSSENGFKNRLSNAVLPELYKEYFVAVNPEYTADVSEEAVKLFGGDVEWTDAKVREEGKKPPSSSSGKPYPEFKKMKIKEIEETILDKGIHKTYALDDANFKKLTDHRPLRILRIIGLSFSVLNANAIFEEINRYSKVDYGFTVDDEKWWQGKEEENLSKKVYDVKIEKFKRVGQSLL
jgi:hypothetical protein